MNKKEIIELTARNADVTQIIAKKVINSYLDVCAEAVKQGDGITLQGLGRFEYRYVKPRHYDFGDKQYDVDEHYKAAFKITPAIRKAVQSLPMSHFEIEGDFEEE